MSNHTTAARPIIIRRNRRRATYVSPLTWALIRFAGVWAPRVRRIIPVVLTLALTLAIGAMIGDLWIH